MLLWVGIVPLSLLFGPFYRAVSPLRTIHLLFTRLTGGGPEDGAAARCRGWVGYWPAALGLLAFVWLELVYPGSTYLSPVRLWFAAYVAIVVVGGGAVRQRLARAAPTRSRCTPRWSAQLSVFGRTARRHAGAAQPARQPRRRARRGPGLVGVVAVLFGSTAFDSFKDSNEWLQFTQSSSRQLGPGSTSARCCCSALVVGVTFAVATMADRGASRASPAVRCRTCSRTRWCRSSSATSWRTTSATSSRSASRRSSSSATRWRTARTCSAPPTWQVSYWLAAHPTFLARAQGARGRDRARARGDRGARPGDQAAAPAAPAHRPAAAAAW